MEVLCLSLHIFHHGAKEETQMKTCYILHMYIDFFFTHTQKLKL